MVPHGLSVWLNIAQIFLSTVNNYITVPTTNKYAENLGVDAAYSGIIIGMSPLAQIFSAFLFSYWRYVVICLCVFLRGGGEGRVEMDDK